jgi:RNA-directed DNA polymerase
MRRIRERLRTQLRALRGATAAAVLHRLSPISRGWAAYYRGVVSSRAFQALDADLWRLTYKWATYSHPNKPKGWVTARYYGRFDRASGDQWVVGSRDRGAYLLKFAWTKIVRHQMVAGRASPDDPALADYWAERRRRTRPPLDRTARRLLIAQNNRCLLCGDLLLHADHEPRSPHEWEQWSIATRKALRKHAVTADRAHGSSDESQPRLIHAHCQRRHTTDTGTSAPLLPTCEPTRLA